MIIVGRKILMGSYHNYNITKQFNQQLENPVQVLKRIIWVCECVWMNYST